MFSRSHTPHKHHNSPSKSLAQSARPNIKKPINNYGKPQKNQSDFTS